LTAAADPVRASLTSWLYRPYIDLTPTGPDGNPQTVGLLFALAAVERDANYPRLHGLYPASFREAILRQARFPEYQLHDPLDLPEELWTSQWETLCAKLQEFDALAPEQRLRVLWLLHRMHLHHAILRYAPAVEPDELKFSESAAAMTFIRGTARLALHYDGESDLDTSDLELVAEYAPPGQWSVVEATYYLSAVTAKKKGNVEEVRHWTDLHRRQIEATAADEHTSAKLWSRYHRVRAFVPQLAGDRAGMTAEMDRAEEWAEAMSRETWRQEAEANVLSCALWESRTKEALVLGDLELAEERVRRCIAFAPLDPQPRLDLGQVLVERGEYEKAADAYRVAAHYGPPATEVALFMLGQCLEKLGNLHAARDAYLSALELDPLGVASLEQLVSVAKTLDDYVVAQWALGRLEALGTVESEELLPYQKYEGSLGVPAST